MMNSAALAARYLEEHPQSTLTRNGIKTLLRSGCIPSVKAGNRVYYSLEAFERYLEHGDKPLDMYGKIRRIV